MRLIVLLLTTLCYDTPLSWTVARAEGQNNSPKRFGRLSKRQDDLGYLEQCSILQFWDKQIGRVNVLAFFDSTWPFSHRQAAMLKVLRERFDKTGFENIQFLAINAAPGESEYVSRAEIEVEEETWKQISPSEAEGVPAIVPSAEALAAALGPDVYFIQDSAELQIWPKLRAFRDQILVIDRCGRLTYQVIVPWSILHFPYVKAAILSTYKDEPCGRCEFRQLFDYSTESSDTSSSRTEESDARTRLADTDEPLPTQTTTTDAATTTEGGNDRSSAERESELLLFSRSDDDRDAQTLAAIDSSTPSWPIDANDEALATPSPAPLLQLSQNATWTDDTTEQAEPFSEQTEAAYAEPVTMPPLDDELSSRTDNYEQVTQLPEDDSAAFTDQPPDASIDNSTSLGDYDSTTFDARDDDYLNATESHYEDDVDDANFTRTTANFETSGDDVENSERLRINVTEEVSPSTEYPAGNSSESSGERRLEDPEEIESIDARDVLKSRSTNARSVSPTDGSDNQLQVIEVKSEEASAAATTKEEGQLEADYLIPIRIIMRAPHVDEYSDRSFKAHEYLVLKTGQPSYHEHLDSVAIHENAEQQQQQQQQQQDKPVRKKPEAVKSTFARDESPGLYGELADYWQNYGNEHAHDDSLDSGSSSFEDDDHEHVLEQEQSFAEGSVTVRPSTLVNAHSKALESDNEQHYDDHSTSYEDADVIDEEAKSKLIAHYSKLLPWLYYVLAK